MPNRKKVIEEIDIPGFQESIDNMPLESRIFVDKSLEIVDYIHYVMEKRGYKQKDLAILMGKSEAELSKILSGMHNITLRSIAKIEAALEALVLCTPKKVNISLTTHYTHITVYKTDSCVAKPNFLRVVYNSPNKAVEMKKELIDGCKLEVA